MSSREPTPTSTNGSTSSFVDAPEIVEIPETEDKETLKEEPLSTPNHSRIQQDPEETVTGETQYSEEEKPKTDIVTIFDVATEIENMLKDISLKVEENDQLVQEKIERINKSLDKIERKIKANNQ